MKEDSEDWCGANEKFAGLKGVFEFTFWEAEGGAKSTWTEMKA